MALHYLNSQSPGAFKGLSSVGAGMTSAGPIWSKGIFSLKQGPENKLLQGPASLKLPVKSAALKNSTKVKSELLDFLGWFKSQSSLISLFDYIIWFCSIIKMSYYWEVAIISGRASWRCPHICTVSMERCWCSGWNGEKACFQHVSAQGPSWVSSLAEVQQGLGTRTGSCRKSS